MPLFSANLPNLGDAEPIPPPSPRPDLNLPRGQLWQMRELLLSELLADYCPGIVFSSAMMTLEGKAA